MFKKKIKDKIAVISLTYNRPEYIKKSFDSLYSKAGIEFDHYVFDDNSNRETRSLLNDLKKKYNFCLKNNESRINIAKNFCLAVQIIPDDYKYYLKFDSDIEFLSNNIVKQAIEVFDFRNKKVSKVSGLTPRVEGVFAFEKYPDDIEYYNGHAIRYRTSVGFGCSMFFTNEVFKEFRKEAKIILNSENASKWGIDTKLYDIALSFGNFLVVEDLSVYHIDNSLGQRKNFEYFTQRKRWDKIDYEEVWFLKASKILFPKFFSKEEYAKIMKISEFFNKFIENCYKYERDKATIDFEVEEKEKTEQKIVEVKKPIILKKMFKITSPLNFRPIEYLTHGNFKYYFNIPEWAKDNPRVVIESENVEYDEKNENIAEFVKE